MKTLLINNAMSLLIISAAFLGVFLQASWDLPRNLVGCPVGFLPPLLVYAAFRTNVPTITAVAGLGGLWVDALSANPVGVSMLPLLLAGLIIHKWRDVILQELVYARFVLGTMASAFVPLTTMGIIMTLGTGTLLGWGFFVHLVVMSLVGGMVTPGCFFVLDAVADRLVPRPVARPSFRQDREIIRGRY